MPPHRSTDDQRALIGLMFTFLKLGTREVFEQLTPDEQLEIGKRPEFKTLIVCCDVESNFINYSKD